MDTALSRLSDPDEDIAKAAKREFATRVATQSRELSPEQFHKFMEGLLANILQLVNNPQTTLSGLNAIDVLIDVDYHESGNTKFFKLNAMMKVCIMKQTTDVSLMRKTADVYGKLVKGKEGENIYAESAEFQMNGALEQLESKNSSQRHIAVLILKQLAQSVPTIFFAQVPLFIDVIWAALYDLVLSVRESAAESLQQALILINKRQNSDEWFTQLWKQCSASQNRPERIHGSLLALGELLRIPGAFREKHFRTSCERILNLKDHKDKLIRKTVISLVPLLAESQPTLFVLNYRHTFINHLLSALSKDERAVPVSFIALGKIALALESSINPYLDQIMVTVKKCLAGRRVGYIEAMQCVSMISEAVGPALKSYMNDILVLMFETGLSTSLTECLTNLVRYIPSYLPIIQERLLDLLSLVLSGKPFYHSGTPASFRKKKVQVQAMDNKKSALALFTLGSFDFSSHVLTELVCESVVCHLDDDQPQIRKEAAITCTKLIISPGKAPPTRGHAASVIARVLAKLLNVGIADTDPNIRRTVLTSLEPRFDHFLAQPDNLRCLFLALNDEVFEIRELAITILGRLTRRNPAYVLPSLRTTLIQLLTELKVGRDNVNKEESALLLSLLVRASHQLVQPYVEPILNALFPKISDSNPRVASCSLAALGELVQVGQEGIKQYNELLLPPIISTLQDQSSSSKREVALNTLGQLIKSTGYVITPFMDYPLLLDILLNEIKTEPIHSIRTQVFRVVGIIGAIDPYKHKITLLKRPRGDNVSSDSVSRLITEEDMMVGLTPSSEDYYPTVAIAKMLRILRDPSLSTNHKIVVEAMVGYICKSLGTKCIPFFPDIMPPILHNMKHCEANFRRLLFLQLATLVSIAKQHIREYLPDIFSCINEFWREPYLVNILSLVEQISAALKDEFKTYLPDLLPQILDSICFPITNSNYDAVGKVLDTLEKFGTQLSDYIHMALPAVVRVFESTSAPKSTRSKAITTMEKLCSKLNFSDYASRIIHPLARVLNEDGELTPTVMDCLCALAYQLGSEYFAFIPMIGKVVKKLRITHDRYSIIERKIFNHEGLLPEDIGETFIPNLRGDSDSSSNINKNKEKVEQNDLKKAWNASHKSTKADWREWLRKFSVELLRQSPSPALRSCKNLAQQYHPLARELFNASFYCSWNELYDANKEDLVANLQTAFENVPPKILQTLLNLAEFMEHHDKPLPIEVSLLSELAVKCNALAKALRYKECEFREAPTENSVASLISIYNELQLHEAAVGILEYSRKYHNITLDESWYEKLQRWDEALENYNRKYQENNEDTEATLGRMQCQFALGRWEELSHLSHEVWKSPHMLSNRSTIAPLAAAAAWNLGEWHILEELVTAMDENKFKRSFYCALLAVHKDKYNHAQHLINKARDALDTTLTALVAESYGRAYDEIVNVQLLAELEEVIEYKQLDTASPRRSLMKEIWKKRLFGSQPNVDLWQRMLSMRAMVCPPHEDLDTWLKFVSLCQKSGRFSVAEKVLSNLLGFSFVEVPSSMEIEYPDVGYAYLKHIWLIGNQEEAFDRMRIFVDQLDDGRTELRAKCCLKLGEWQLALSNADSETLLKEVIPNVLVSFKSSTCSDKNWYKAWHMWALTNFTAIQLNEEQGAEFREIREFIFPAVKGFFRSIALAPFGQNLQDTLRLLTLWFQYGRDEDVQLSIMDGFTTVSIDNWLQVIPQIIARIHTGSTPVRRMIHDLLAKIGQAHPQALLYSLNVASKSLSVSRKEAALRVIDTLRSHSPTLVDQSQIVAQELIRVAILWNEIWHEGLEDASCQFFHDNNIEGMLDIVIPLHEMVNRGPETMQETNFRSQYGRVLMEAYSCIQRYKENKQMTELDNAWRYYQDVFRKIEKQLKYHQQQFELHTISPKLEEYARDLSIAMPGTYKANQDVVTIQSFESMFTVIASKQRPRKLTINGSDGLPYHFLLKGHEDLRQDERVMQLFGLVNTLLESNLETAKRHLNIQRYSVCPLSPNSGLIGWVPLHDTLHALIRDYRESKKIVLNVEHRTINTMTSQYDLLTLMQKVEVFDHALEFTSGMDLDRILWLKSRNSETWLDRRTNYTRSLAVMSMVGYILGLGDRHPSNLMLHRLTGKILHIDFGDCFEVAMFREKFPEKIPFRLTRMLRNAMEVSGIEGNFRYTCERVMEVMRENKQSLMAVLEAFVHDPLLNWRLLTASPPADNFEDIGPSRRPHEVVEGEAQYTENLNSKALQVIKRVSAKLTGTDFPSPTGEPVPLKVEEQVQRLIDQASSHENLCQCYIGWCPFW